MSADPDDPDQPVVAFDFTTGSLTADPDLVRNEPDPVAALASYLSVAQYGATINPWIRFLNFIQFGYTVVTVEPCATTIDYRGIDVYDESAQPATLARFRIHHEATSMETQYFETPCWSLPDPDANPVPPFALGTGITDPVACPDLPVTTTTTTTTSSAPSTTTGQSVAPTTAGVTTTLPPSPPAPPQPGSPDFVG